MVYVNISIKNNYKILYCIIYYLYMNNLFWFKILKKKNLTVEAAYNLSRLYSDSEVYYADCRCGR
jgi:hypothetical protein